MSRRARRVRKVGPEETLELLATMAQVRAAGETRAVRAQSRSARDERAHVEGVKSPEQEGFRLRSQVLERYARLGEDGGLILCTPSWAERQSAAKSGHRPLSDRKVIFDGRENAAAAAAAFAELGSKPQEPYVCHRSTRRHHLHLRTIRGRGID